MPGWAMIPLSAIKELYSGFGKKKKTLCRDLLFIDGDSGILPNLFFEVDINSNPNQISCKTKFFGMGNNF